MPAVLPGDEILADHYNLAEEGINVVAVTSGTDTTTSSSYVNLAGTGSVTSFSIVKRHASSRLRIDMAVNFYSTDVAGGGDFAVRVNSVDYDVCWMKPTLPAAPARLNASGFLFITGLAAATYTVQGRWRRDGGAGTLTRTVSDRLMISARETAN